jgi:hypothetical protein
MIRHGTARKDNQSSAEDAGSRIQFNLQRSAVDALGGRTDADVAAPIKRGDHG